MEIKKRNDALYIGDNSVPKSPLQALGNKASKPSKPLKIVIIAY
jgi:hypothetical protein